MQGLLLLDKPEGITSFGAVARIKRISGEKRVGHTGTLDPLATGVLPVFLGRATALSSFLSDADKRYTARVRLGLETDSCDITGNVVSECDVSVTEEKLKDVLSGFKGELRQQPPIYSAIKKDGVRLYEIARRGETADIPFRNITVHSLELLCGPDENNEFEISTLVSKGTYIRSLARDIGRKLGCGATLTALRRTFAAGFGAEDCISLSELSAENISERIINEENAVTHLRKIYITEKQAARFVNGGGLSAERISLKDPHSGELFRVKLGEKLLGIGEYNAEKEQICVKCVLILPEQLRAQQEGLK